MQQTKKLLLLLVSTQFCLLLGLVNLISAQTVSQNPTTLKSVQILFRHGTREPDNAGFGQPNGQLKPIGKKEMYDLGIFFRQRYSDLIGQEYNENEISIVSSDVDRTIQSASLVSFGLYKDFNLAASWSEDEKIQFEPIPVRTIPKKYDKYLQMLSDCPRRAELEDEAFDLMYGRFLENNGELVDYYALNAGDQTILDTSLRNRDRLRKMVMLQEELIMNQTSHLPIVDWAQPLLKSNAFLSLKTNNNREMTSTVEKKRLFGGSLLKLFVENLEQPADTRKKMHLFSGHDRILVIIMFTLGIYDPLVYTMPPTGASFHLELHEPFGLGAKSFVQLWYRNETRKEPHLLELPNCGTPCYLPVFKELTKEFMPVDFEAECTPVIDPILNTYAPALSQMNTAFYVTAVISLLAIVAVFQIILIKRRNYNRLQ